MKRGTSSGQEKSSMAQFLYLLLVVYIGFYTRLYHFLQLFKRLFSINGKKKFCNKIFISNGFTQTPHPINGHNPQSMMKFFCQRYLNYDH